MQKKSIIVVLCSLAAIMVAALVLVFSLNPLVSAMSKTPDTLVLTEADFKIKDHVLLGLKEGTAKYIDSLYRNAYYGCGELDILRVPTEIQVQIPEGVTAIEGWSNGSGGFLSRYYYNYDYDYDGDGTVDDWGTNNDYSAYFIHDSVKMSFSFPSTLKTIGDNAFYDCYNLKSLTLPDGVTSIGDNAFYSCYNLKSITLPDSVTSIGDYAFSYCYDLKSITLPASVTEIGQYLFAGCNNNNIEIKAENPALYENPNLKPYMVGVLDQREHFTFDENGVLVGLSTSGQNIANEYGRIEVVMPDDVTVVGAGESWRGIFSGRYDKIIAIDLPDNLQTIQRYAFYNCYNLTSIDIPDGVTSIGDRAFYSCSNLKSITLPASVTEIGQDAFNSCGIIEVKVENPALLSSPELQRFFPVVVDQSEYFAIDVNGAMIGLSSEGTDLVRNARDKGQNVTIKIPAGVTAVGRDDHQPMFQNWVEKEAIKALILPDSLRTIKDGAFSDCYYLTNIDIPEGVTAIGNGAFSGCTRLETITVPASVVEVGEFAFGTAGTFTNDNGEYTKIIVGSSELYHNSNMAIYQDIMVKGYDAAEDPTEPDEQNQQPTPVDPIDANPVQNPDQNEVSQVEQTVIANRANHGAVVAGVAGGSAAGVLVTCGIFGLVLIARRRR